MDKRHEAALVLWLNSTFGILSLAGCRVPTQGPWGKYKKPILERMRVIDPGQLTETQLNRFYESLEHLKRERLQPLSRLNEDDVRMAFDQAICNIINIPGIGKLRFMLAREPVISGTGLYAYADEELQGDLFASQSSLLF